MLISAYTPTNNPTWLHETYRSLQKQTYDHWEWVLVPNGTDQSDVASVIAAIKGITKDDSKVRVCPHSVTHNVGGLKQYACGRAKGDILVELDHDDILTSDCFESLVEAHSKTKAGFFYSDWVGFRPDGSFDIYDSAWGWDNYPFEYEGQFMRAITAFEPSARSLCEIYYAPNHVRAWTREAYDATGGYNPGLIVADDHDLVCRTYLTGMRFAYIHKPLYLYRQHETNTVKLFNAKIQTQQADNRNKYVHKLVQEECRRKSLTMLNLGPFTNPHTDYIDYEALASRKFKLSQKDDSVGVVHANDFLQLVPQKQVKRVLEEIYRVLVPGGWLLTATPSTDGRGAFQDLRHLSYWNQNSWLYFVNSNFHKHYYPRVTKNSPRFQAVRTWTEYPSDWHKQHNIPYVYADLCALKGQRQPGFKEI